MNFAQLMVVLLLFFLFTLVISVVIWSIKNGISPMPSTAVAKKALLALLPEKLEGKIYELGSGWGTLLIPLAKKFSSCQIIGFETSPLPYLYSKLRCMSCSNVQLHYQDFFSANLKEADLVVCYLYLGAMEKLKTKLEVELQPGALVVSNTFAIHGWIPERVLELDDIYKTKVYLYRRK
jgi:hypothetical protein